MLKKIFVDFSGNLGNIIKQAYYAYYICQKYNLDYNIIHLNNKILNKTFYKNAFSNVINNFYDYKNDYNGYSLIIDDFYGKIKIDNQLIGDIFINNLSKIDVPYITLKRFRWFNIPDKKLMNIFKNEELLNVIKSKYSNIINDNVYVFNIRRGDFLKIRSFNKYVLDINQIYNCIDYIQSENNKCVFLISSDDIEWCKRNIKYDNIIFHDNIDPYTDCLLFSRFKNIIIAPGSSYSQLIIDLSDTIKNIINPLQIQSRN